MKVLVTGGCGFIGSHLVDRLLNEGHKVKVLDILEPQVHQGKRPPYLNKEAEYIFADIRKEDVLKKALQGIEVVFHQAAQVGVGQSMYQIEKYVSHNSYGTAILLDTIVNGTANVKKIIVASSMSIYGEGAYQCKECSIVYPQLRSENQLKERNWEMLCPTCSRQVEALPTNEEKPLFPTSVYATTKRSQEEMCLGVGRAYRIPTVALRYFNVYGPRQSLNNPYTGVAAIFLSQVKNDHQPRVFEDGRQSRDFVYVSDIIEANMLALTKDEADYKTFNVGTGISHSIAGIAQTIIGLYKKDMSPAVLNKFRAGDIRHCYADITRISQTLGFSPQVSFEEGMRKLIEWSQSQEARDSTQQAQQELQQRGLAE